MLIRRFGVPSRQIIIGIIVSMRIIFKILEEIRSSIIMSPSNAHFGKKIRT